MATNEPLNNAVDEVAAAEAELKAAQEKLEAAKAKLAAESDDACPIEEVTVTTVVVDEETDEVEAVIVEEVSAPVCDVEPAAVPQEAAPEAEADAEAAPAPKPETEPEPEPDWVPYSTAPQAAPSYAAAPQSQPQPQPQPPTGAPAQPAGAPVPPAGVPVGGAAAPAQPAPGYYAAPGYGQPQTPPHAGPGAVPPQQQPYYGYQQPYYQQPHAQPMVTTKDHVAAGLLAIFLGAFGIHKFYLGYNTAGFIMLAVTIIGGVLTFTLASWVIWIIAIIEGILYLTKSQSEFEQIYVLNKREWF